MMCGIKAGIECIESCQGRSEMSTVNCVKCGEIIAKIDDYSQWSALDNIVRH